VSWIFVVLAALLFVVAWMAARSGRIAAALISGAAALAFVAWICRDCSQASVVALEALARVEESS